MNTNAAGKDENFRTKRNDLRRKGIFCILGGIVFLLEGLLSLNTTLTGYILAALGVIYVFLFAEKETAKPPAPLAQRIVRYLVEFALLILAFFIIAVAWGWIWRTTGIDVSFLAAATFILMGLGLIGWSYRVPHKR